MNATEKLVLPKTRELWVGQGGINGGLYEPRGQEARILIVAIDSLKEGIAWGEYGKRIDGADDQFDGRVNTKAILAAEPKNALACLAENLVIDGHQDFYIPSIGELRHLYNTVGDLIRDAFDDTDVWSSTQYSAYSAWLQYFDGGRTDSWGKDDKAGALAVRSISASVLQ